MKLAAASPAQLHRALVLYPGLVGSYRGTPSRSTLTYNCLAWAVGLPLRWWEAPEQGKSWALRPREFFWPRRVPKSDSLESLLFLFKKYGYELCANGSLQPGYIKVAIYQDGKGEVTHVARQLPDGWWTSKLGFSVDIEHATLEALEGPEIGQALVFVRRPQKKSDRASR